MNNQLTYILSKPDYFAQDTKGAVTHAMGVIEGYTENNWKVYVVSGHCDLNRHGAKLVLKNNDLGRVEFIAILEEHGFLATLRWRMKLYRETARHISKTKSSLMVRYAVSQPLFLLKLAYLAKKNNINSIVEVNSNAYNMYPRLQPLLRLIILKIECLILRKFKFVYVVSHKLGKDLERGGVPANKIVVVPNGSSPLESDSKNIEDSSILSKNNNIDDSSAHIKVIYAGAFHVYYNFKVLITAFKKLEDTSSISLHFYGYGKMESHMRDLAGDAENIYFHGKFSRDDLHTKLNKKTDVFILPYADSSTANIGSPIKMFEYMAHGLPIVASSVGQVSTIFENNKSAYLYNPNDIDSLVDTFNRMLSDTNRPKI